MLARLVVDSQLCAEHGISRKTGHKWLARYAAGGVAGLADASHARHTQQLKIAGPTAMRIIALRAAHQTWGPRKLLARLRLDEPGGAWPSASTVGDLLRREGLSDPGRIAGLPRRAASWRWWSRRLRT